MKYLAQLFLLLGFFSCSTTQSQITSTCAYGDCFNGTGRIVHSNGGSYEGSFVGGKAEGEGVAYYANGDILEGYWEDDFLIDGTYYYTNGDQYTGTFEKTRGVDFINGEYIWDSGQIYMGGFDGVKRNGLGAEYWIDGSAYIGSYKQDRRDGPGILYLPDGTTQGGFWDYNQIYTPIAHFNLEDLENALGQSIPQKLVGLVRDHTLVLQRKKKFSEENAITKNFTVETNKILLKEKNKPIITLLNEFYQLSNDTVTLRGNIQDESKIIIVVINGKEVQLDQNGAFEEKIYVPIGDSVVQITAIDEWENATIQSVPITRTYSKESFLVNVDEGLNPLAFIAKPINNRYALILGVGQYETIKGLPNAENDAAIFFDYATNALGIPSEQIILSINPELKDMYKSFHSIQKIIPQDADLFVYYSGHGINYQNENLLLASDFDVSVIKQTSLPQNEMIEMIKQANPQSVTLILDTCFSGLGREGEQLVDSRFITIAQSNTNIPENFTIVSSSSQLEWSRDHEIQNNGLFTYYLLKGLEKKADTNNDQSITLKELFDYTKKNVQQSSNFEQNPEISSFNDYVLTQWK